MNQKGKCLKFSGDKGSVTVEAALVIPVIILAITATMYITMILYRYALFQIIANDAAERSVIVWKYLDGENHFDISSGFVDYGDLKGSYYWRLYDLKKEMKEETIENYMNAYLHHYMLLGNSDKDYQTAIKSKVEVRNFITGKRVNVSIEEMRKIPLGSVNKLLGIKDSYVIQVQARTTMKDPAELIRNIDFSMEVIQKNNILREVYENIEEKTVNIRRKVEDMMKEE